jgi:superfamily II DNA or RNA helicase
MIKTQDLLESLREAVTTLNERQHFDNGKEFRPTQHQALKAYKADLYTDQLSDEEKIKGFFKLPTGVGKTAIFVGIIAEMMKALKKRGIEPKIGVVVPVITLLNQTLGSFAKFAPSTKNLIGLYGDGNKDADQPITIMTYDGWYDLTKAGVFGSHNLHILISDESHRGTSERRIEAILGAYDSRTIQLAFTATSHFNEGKSVESTHKRKIFEKSLYDAVMDKELASYIHVQEYGICAQPTKWMLSEEFNEASNEEKSKERRHLKKRAWNHEIKKIYLNGRDQITNDPFTDNQTGFFVNGISQANHLEKLLNSDPELQRRAAEQGYEGVALTIHSRLSPNEQKRRLKAYKAGKYMAIIGDEKFKEGFDHPPMKTVFDSPRSSAVDKEQIIGRGARKWWNEKKQRWEGMTIIDTFLYIGDPDKKKQALNRERAISETIFSIKILGATNVLGPEAPKTQNKPVKSKGNGGNWDEDVLRDDPNLECYITEEETHIISADISRIAKEHIIEITEEMYAELREEVERTGIGGTRFYTLLQKRWPKNLSPNIITPIVRGEQQSISKDHWEWIMEQYKSFDTIVPTRKIRITTEMRNEFEHQVERTGIKAHVFHDHFKEEWPKGLSPQLINRILSGDAKSILKDHWEWIMEHYKSFDTITPMTRIEITPKMRNEFKHQVERTAIKSITFNKRFKKNWPNGLSPRIVGDIISGKAKSIVKDHWEWIMEHYKSFDTVAPMTRIEITSKMLSELEYHVERTNIKDSLLHDRFKKVWPEGLSAKIIAAIRRQDTKTLPEPHWNFIIETYASLPDAKPKLKGKLSTAFDTAQAQNEIEETQAKATKPQHLQNRQP